MKYLQELFIKSIILFLIFHYSVEMSQAEKPVIDSLKLELDHAYNDSIYGYLTFRIWEEYLGYNADSADYYYQKLYNFSKKDGERVIAKLNRLAGTRFYDHEMYAKSESHFESALKYYKKAKDKPNEAFCLKNLGLIYQNLALLPEAIEYYLKAKDIYAELNDMLNIQMVSNYIASVYIAINEYDKALKILLENLEYIEKNPELKDEYGIYPIAMVHRQIGIVYQSIKEYDLAFEHLNVALDLFKKLNDLKLIASIYNTFGIIYSDSEEYLKAIAYYDTFLVYSNQTKNVIGVNLAKNNLGDSYMHLGKYKIAEKYCLECYNWADSIGFFYLVHASAGNLANTYKELGNYKKAYDFLMINKQYKDSLNKIEKKEKIAQLEMQHNFEVVQQNQKLQIEKQESEIGKQKLLRNFALIGIILMLIGLYFAIRSFQIKKKAAIQLEKQRNEIAEKNEELSQQNEEIQAQRDEIEAQRDLVTSQKEVIEHTHLEISQSIDYAKRIQTSILPDDDLLDKFVSDYFVLFKPKDKVSGDFYWWTHIENHTIITAADCTGHGVPGAFMSMLGISFLREIVNKEYMTQPDVILRKLRKEVIKVLKQKGITGEQKDGMDMALISINHETNELQFAGAQNPLYLFRNGELIEIKGDKMPIAIHLKMDKFTLHEMKLEKDDHLYIFSDGFADQFGGPDGKKFKYKPFKELIQSNLDKPMNKQKENLNITFEQWKGDFEQIDDVVVLGIKI